MVAITLRKLAELELAAATAEEAAAAAAGSAAQQGGAAGGSGSGEKGGSGGASALSLKERERQQALVIAREAFSIAQQSYTEALEWERRKGQPEEGGLLAWLRPSRPQLSTLRRPQRPDSAALEVAQCLQTLSHAHAAAQDEAAAATDLEAALQLLDDAFPAAATARSTAAVEEDEAQRADQQEVAAAAPAAGSGREGGASSSEEEGEEGSGAPDAESAVTLAAALSAKEHARALRVEGARKQLACGMLAELLGLAQGGQADAAAVQQRLVQEGCGAGGS